MKLGGGEGGIRTHEGVNPTRFRDARTRPNYATSPRRSQTCQALRHRLGRRCWVISMTARERERLAWGKDYP